MSTNIHFVGTRDIQVIRSGHIETQEICFNEWQTPSDVTRQIMASADPVQTYKAWVLSVSEDVEIDTYDKDDIFGENPTGKEIHNYGREHVAEFDKWLEMCERECYTVVAQSW